MDYILQLIKKFLKLKIPASLTLHFDGSGNFKTEVKLGDKATKDIFEKIN